MLLVVPISYVYVFVDLQTLFSFQLIVQVASNFKLDFGDRLIPAFVNGNCNIGENTKVQFPVHM